MAKMIPLKARTKKQQAARQAYSYATSAVAYAAVQQMDSILGQYKDGAINSLECFERLCVAARGADHSIAAINELME